MHGMAVWQRCYATLSVPWRPWSLYSRSRVVVNLSTDVLHALVDGQEAALALEEAAVAVAVDGTSTGTSSPQTFSSLQARGCCVP